LQRSIDKKENSHHCAQSILCTLSVLMIQSQESSGSDAVQFVQTICLALSWLSNISSTKSILSAVTVEHLLPLPGFRLTVPV